MTMWVIATFVAFFVKGVCGFANTLVFTSILSYGTANANISPTELLIGYPMNLLMTWNNRKELKTKVWLPLSLLVLFGSIPGAFILKNVDAGIIKVFFGLVVSVLGVQMFLQEYQHKTTKPSKITMLIMGIVGGMLCGLFGVGAMLGVCVTRMTDTMTEFKGNVSMVFAVENTIRLITYAVLGLFAMSAIRTAMILIVIALIGMFAGMQCSKFMKDTTVKKIVIILLILSGISLIIQNI